MKDLLLRLPSVAAWVERVLHGFFDGRSVVVVAPDVQLLDLLSTAVDAGLWTRDWDVRRVNLAELPATGSTTTRLFLGLGVIDKPSGHAPEDVLSIDRFPDLVHLQGWDQLSLGERGRWTDFLSRYAAASQGRAADSPRRPPVFLAAMPGGTNPEPPDGNVRLEVRWWWGFPSVLEVQLICRQMADGEVGAPRNRWRESAFASLALNDVQLAEHLRNCDPTDLDGVMSALREYGERRGWTVDELCSANAREIGICAWDGHAARLEGPPPGHRRLYAMGALCCTPESGIELHSAAAALLGWEDVVRHRLWRAQCQSILPIIEAARVSYCRRLTSRYGPDWPIRWFRPEDDREDMAVAQDPSAAGWGHIESLVRKVNSLRPERRLQQPVRRLRLARNELAHSWPVSIGRCEQLLAMAGRLGRRSSDRS